MADIFKGLILIEAFLQICVLCAFIYYSIGPSSTVYGYVVENCQYKLTVRRKL